MNVAEGSLLVVELKGGVDFLNSLKLTLSKSLVFLILLISSSAYWIIQIAYIWSEYLVGGSLFSQLLFWCFMETENLWRSLVENPNKWWDNRSSKVAPCILITLLFLSLPRPWLKLSCTLSCTQLKPSSPDFKHKDTGEGLWIGSSTPAWVLPKLPPVPTKQGDGLEKVTV